jgi:uncharacterized membrane protein
MPMKTDRLTKIRFLTIGVIVAAVFALFIHEPIAASVLCIMGSALEIIRLELRDIRAELLKKSEQAR